MTIVNAYAAFEAGKPLGEYSYELGPIESDQVDIKVEYCGICHSDLSMIDNAWRMSKYPIVPGHEVVGVIQNIGSNVKSLKIGQRVGLGWMSNSCCCCHECLSGDHNLCLKGEQTIVGRQGGFADIVRCQALWAVPLPEALSAKEAGPLFCGGITVFNPIIQFGVKPTDKVGVIGIGGLGHLALQFLSKWGCEVTAFTSSEGKFQEAKDMGAHYVLNSNDKSALQQLQGKFDFILNTTNVDLEWNFYINALAPKGRLHTVGTVPKPIPVPAFSMIQMQRSISGSPLGSPATLMDMLEFAARHKIAPVVEIFKMHEVNEAIEHLKSGKARYRVVLEN